MNGEAAFITAVRGMNIQQGNYMFPGVESPKDVNTPEHQKKYNDGPRGILQILPMVNMGKNWVTHALRGVLHRWIDDATFGRCAPTANRRCQCLRNPHAAIDRQ